MVPVLHVAEVCNMRFLLLSLLLFLFFAFCLFFCCFFLQFVSKIIFLYSYLSNSS